MKISLIITTYNSPKFLKLVLKSIKNLTVKPHEIIIADDGSRKDVIEENIKNIKKLGLKYKYIWQEDKGFRAALIRNKAILVSEGEYIIGIDGDVILHKDFIKDHIKYAKKGRYIQGKRVLLSKEKTKEVLDKEKIKINFWEKGIKNRKNAIHFDLLARILSRVNNKIKGVKTCNFSMFRSDILKINGFNNDFIGWGREDSEFVARFLNAGGERFDLRFNAIVYHLYHPEEHKKIPEKNERLLKETLEKKFTTCKNGILQIKEKDIIVVSRNETYD